MSVLLLALCALTPSSIGALHLRAHDTNAKTSNGTAITDDSTLTTAWKYSLCGKLPSYGNAKPKNYADAMPTFFNTVTKKREAKLYKSGDNVVFQCLPGFTTDGSKDGPNTFDAKCTGADVPYFAPGGVCMKASKCGAVPEIADATATTKVIPGSVEFACNPGYSLDGEKVVAGGTQKNVLFTVKCIEFSGAYEAFKGKCKSYKFMASGPAIRMTTNVFEALFTVNCKGKLVDSFGKLTQGTVQTAPTVDCTTITTADAKTSSGQSCGDLVKDLTEVFNTKSKALAEAKASPNREWFDKSQTDPNVDKEAMAFCTKMWGLTQKKMPEAAQLESL